MTVAPSPSPTVARQSGPTLEGIPRMGRENLASFKRSVLYKGPSGTGKTYSAFSWPQPILAIYADPNTATVQGMIESGADIDPCLIERFDQVTDRIIPMAKARLIQARTLVIDSIDFLADLMWREIQGGKTQMSSPDWGRGQGRLAGMMRDLADCIKPRPGKLSYNIVVTSHVKTKTNEEGNKVAVTSNIKAFREELESYFNSVFLCETDEVSDTVTENGRSVLKRRPVWFIHTVPPDTFNTCKESIGGLGGLKRLPARMGGTYAELCAGWGCEPEPNGLADQAPK